MAEQAPTRPTPIYVSYLTFTNLLDWLRELGTLPSQFDRSFWGHKFSGSGGGQLMAGLRFLGLLDGDTPTDELERMALANDEDRKALLIQLLKDRYGADFIASLPRTTPKLVNDRLRDLGTTDATHDKARSFFVNAAKAVGLQMPPQVAKQARNRPSVTRKTTRRRSGSETTSEGQVQQDEQAEQAAPRHPPRDEVEIPTGLAGPLVPLVRDLVRIGTGWDQATHDRWLGAFTTLLDYSYPVKESEG